MPSRWASATFCESARPGRRAARERRPPRERERRPGMRAPGLEARHHHLLRCEPDREPAAVVLEEDAEERSRLPRSARWRTTGRCRPPAPSWRASSKRPAAPGPPASSRIARSPEPVAEHELELRPVEGPLSGLLAPLESRGPRRVDSNASARSQTASSPSRCDGRPENATWTSSKPSDEYRARRLGRRGQLRGDLILAAEDVAVILDELSEAEEPVERPRRLVPVDQAELGEAQRQLAPPRRHPSHQLHVSGTADRFQRPGLALHHEHPLANTLQWPLRSQTTGRGPGGCAPHGSPGGGRSAGCRPRERGRLEPARVPEHAAGGLLLEVEQPQAVAEGAVIIVVQHGRNSGARPG